MVANVVDVSTVYTIHPATQYIVRDLRPELQVNNPGF